MKLLAVVAALIFSSEQVKVEHLGPVGAGLSCITGSDCNSGLWCKWRGDEAFGRCLP